jgi:hypothetical protein
MSAVPQDRRVDPVQRLRDLDELERRGAELAGVLATAAAGLVDVLATAIETGLWEGDGFRSVEHWAAVRFGLSGARAASLVRAARALRELPACAAAFESGEIGEDHVREIVRAGLTTDNDETAVELARHATVSQFRKGLSFLPRPEPAPDPDDSDERPPAPGAAHVSFGHGDDATWSLHVSRLDALGGALAEKALGAARDACFADRHGRAPEGSEEAAQVTWASAFDRMCQAALAQLDPRSRDGRPPSERYLVNVHLDAEHPERSRLHLGPALPPSIRSLLLCDSQVRLWMTDRLGNVGLGRRERVVDPRLRTVVEARDGGCIIPGCPVTRNLEIHHLDPWEHEGPTESWNLVATCRGPDGHHRQLHDGRIRIEGNPDRPDTLRILDARGRPIGPAPPRPPTSADPSEAAADLGLPDQRWHNRSGERAHWEHLAWHDLPPPPDAA